MIDLFENIEIQRIFQMPNSNTFSIPAIHDFIYDNIKKDWYIADPFARNNMPKCKKCKALVWNAEELIDKRMEAK